MSTEKQKEYMKEWRKKNAAKIKAQKAAAYTANKEELKAKQRAYTAANKEAVNARRKAAYRAKNPDPKERGRVPFTEKVCPACGVLKLREDYYKKLTTRSHLCKSCTDKVTVAHRQANPEKHLEYGNKSRRLRYQACPEYREQIAAQKKAWRDADLEGVNTARRNRYATDADYRAACLAHNRRLMNACPPWADMVAIREVYKTCPEGFEVDHIIPLKGVIDGRPVSGLHVAENLQHLSVSENRKKYCVISEAYL